MACFRKRGNKWQAQIKLNGSPVIAKTFDLKADAIVWARSIEANNDRSVESAAGVMATTTFGQLIERYRVEISSTKRSARQESYRLNRFMTHPMHTVMLKDLTTGTFASYRNERSKTCGTQQVRHELNLLGHIIKVATIDWDYPFIKNPVDAIRKPKIPPGRTRRLIPGELEKMHKGMEDSVSTYLMPMIELAIETSMRKGEILALEWANIDFRKCLAHLPMTKNGFPRTVPLSTKAMEIIRSRFGLDKKRVFAVSVTAVRLAFDRLLKRVNIDDLHFHDLRHEAITRLFERGLAVPEVAIMSGHREYRMLARYTHISPEELVKKLG